VSFVDFPEGHTQGESRDEAFRMAVDCLHACIEYRLEEKAEIPVPSPINRRAVAIPVPLEIAPKVALYQAMRTRKMSNLKLANNLHVSETAIRRMLDPKHRSKPEQYTRALLALGCAVQVSLVSIAR
jgi:antitoxin HicB